MSTVNVGSSRTNWAGNIAYQAAEFYQPQSIPELQAIVGRTRRIRVLGTGHSFNDMADSPGAQVSLAGLTPDVETDSGASQVRVPAGMTYAQMAPRLHRAGYALRNLASLPHISVGGACATGTHGSGPGNQNLTASVAAMEIVTADGDLVEVGRHTDSFGGMLVHLGALGVVARLVLDVVPAFDAAQRVYENLPLDVLDDHMDELMSAAYSVSLFTDWRAPRLNQVWFKQRISDPDTDAAGTDAAGTDHGGTDHGGTDDGGTAAGELARPVPDAPWFTATAATGPRNPVPGAPPDSCTQQLGVPGRWYDRLPHFRPEFTPSAGDELQTEYLLPAQHAAAAIRALHEISATIAPVLQICEVRMIAADTQWLSPAYLQDSVAFHFTWVQDLPAVLPVVTSIEHQLAPFAPRPHWGKVFALSAETLADRYARLPDFLDLIHTYDPTKKFQNPYTTRYLSP